MNRPLTDRERCHQLEARVVELEDELAAYRGAERSAAAIRAAALREHAMKSILRDAIGKNGPLGLTARLALTLMDKPPGYPHRWEALGLAITLGDAEAPVASAKVARTYLRKAVRAWALDEDFTVIWGYGLTIQPRLAEAFRSRLTAAMQAAG